MKTKRRLAKLSTLSILSIFITPHVRFHDLEAAVISWDGGGGNSRWGVAANWFSDGSPSGQDVRIGNMKPLRPDRYYATELDAFYTVNSLSISNGGSVANALEPTGTAHRLTVRNATEIGDGRMTLYGRPDGAKSLITESLRIKPGGSLFLESRDSGRRAVASVQQQTTIEDGGWLSGSGAVELWTSDPSSSSSPPTALRNDGLISTAPGRNLHLYSPSANARIDLDGSSESGYVEVYDRSELWIGEPLADPFSSYIRLDGGGSLKFDTNWDFRGRLHSTTTSQSDGAAVVTYGDSRNTMTMDAPGEIIVDAQELFGEHPSQVPGGWLSVRSDFRANGGTITNTGLISFLGSATYIAPGADFQMVGPKASLSVGRNATVTIKDASFDLEGDGLATNITTIQSGGTLNLHLDFDARSGDDGNNDEFTHTINLQGGTLNVFRAAGTEVAWSIGRTLNVTSASTSVLGGATLSLKGPANVLIGPDATLELNTENTELQSGATITMSPGAKLGGSSPLRLDPGSVITGEGDVEVKSRITRNDGTIRAQNGTFVFSSPLNDWSGHGRLVAEDSGVTLYGAGSAFQGEIEAIRSGIAINGRWNFGSNSTITLTGGHLASSDSTDFEGSILIMADAARTSRLLAYGAVLRFTDQSRTVLDGDLRLESFLASHGETQIASGATFEGNASLHNSDGHLLGLSDGAKIDVPIVNAGVLRPTGVVRIEHVEQSVSGTLDFDLARGDLFPPSSLVVVDSASLAGELRLGLGESYELDFTVSLGDTFNILTSATPIVGQFSTIVQPPSMPTGLMFVPIYGSKIIQVAVVNDTRGAGDWDDDGDFDDSDFAYWESEYGSQLTGSHLLAWQRNFTEPSAPAARNVPEPCGLPAVLLVITSAMRGRISRRLT